MRVKSKKLSAHMKKLEIKCKQQALLDKMYYNQNMLGDLGSQHKLTTIQSFKSNEKEGSNIKAHKKPKKELKYIWKKVFSKKTKNCQVKSS